MTIDSFSYPASKDNDGFLVGGIGMVEGEIKIVILRLEAVGDKGLDRARTEIALCRHVSAGLC